MTSDTAFGIFNRLGNNKEDTAYNEISLKNTFSTYRKNNKGEPAAKRPGERSTSTPGSKTHPHPEVPLISFSSQRYTLPGRRQS
jgi:hypothetical protein